MRQEKLDANRGIGAFQEHVREAEKLLLTDASLPDAIRAEGSTYLAGMVVFYLERAFKGSDPDHPAFVRDMDQFRHWGLPTPDHHYYSAQIDGAGTYRIRCRRGNTVDFCFEVLSGLAGDDGVVGDRIDALEVDAVLVEPDGSFEVWVGGPPRAGNWMKAGPSAHAVFVRQTVSDWDMEQPTPMLIERMDAPSRTRPKRISNAEVQDAWERAGRGLLTQVRWLRDFATNWTKVLPVNDFPSPSVGPADAGYFPGQFNTKGRWEISPDTALVITIPPNDCAYQSLTLAHPTWFNLLDPRFIQGSLTRAQSRASSDRVFRYVISATDPGVWNWLDTAGLTDGFVFMRFQRSPSGQPPAAPTAKLVPLADLRDEFPPDEPFVGPDERAANARLRRLNLERRYA